MAQCDLILVGGSGDFSVLDNEPWVHAFLDFIADTVVGRSFPAFCSCFGFQALVAAGGGEVIHDAVNTEVGTFEIVLNEAGMADPLLGTLGPQFLAQLGHKDRAKRIPAGMTQLGRSERCPYQALRVDGTQIFATQFHPELNLEANLHRYVTYREGYSRGGYDPGQDAVIQSMRETPGATALLPRWVQQVASNQD
jgi:GMP synthase (glutamine-hydrolysing)